MSGVKTVDSADQREFSAPMARTVNIEDLSQSPGVPPGRLTELEMLSGMHP
jgi:hypothetical protein